MKSKPPFRFEVVRIHKILKISTSNIVLKRIECFAEALEKYNNLQREKLKLLIYLAKRRRMRMRSRRKEYKRSIVGFVVIFSRSDDVFTLQRILDVSWKITALNQKTFPQSILITMKSDSVNTLFSYVLV